MKPNPRRRPKKLEAREAALKQHRKTAEIGVNPKYLHGVDSRDKPRLSKEWGAESRRWDIENGPGAEHERDIAAWNATA